MNLIELGMGKIQWAEEHMPVIMKIEKDFKKTKPLKNIRIAAALHITEETALLCKIFEEGGAKVNLCASNPLSTKDDVVAALRKSSNVKVFAKYGETKKEYYKNMQRALENKPDIIIDDGADLIALAHSEKIDGIIGGQEETTTGVIRLKAMEKKKQLRFPVVAVNDAETKMMFDNRYGTGQSALTGILEATNVMIAGKNFVVCGYGWCGKGAAARARGMGANVIVVEVNPRKALEAYMDGFRVMPIKEAAKIGDIFLTTTGDIHVIREAHFKLMKSGAILANAGHFNVEIDVDALEKMASSKKQIRKNTMRYEFENGKYIYLLAEGRLVNLVAADGHPSEVLDLSFSNQALVSTYLARHGSELQNKVYNVPEEIDHKIARLKLETLGIKIDSLTLEQKKYLSSWKIGT